MCYGTENECAKCVYKFENGKNKSNLLFCLGMNFNFVARTIYILFQMSHNIQNPIKVWKTIHNTGTRSFSHSIKWTIIYFFRMFVHCLFHFLCPVSLSQSFSLLFTIIIIIQADFQFVGLTPSSIRNQQIVFFLHFISAITDISIETLALFSSCYILLHLINAYHTRVLQTRTIKFQALFVEDPYSWF